MRGQKRVITQLSVSQNNKGTGCAHAWYLHYVKGYRPVLQSAALLFGTAFEAGLTPLVLHKGDDEVRAAFDRAWHFQKINGKLTPLSRCIDIIYAESDFDEELLTDDDRELIATTFKLPIADLSKEIDKVYEEKGYAGYAEMPDERKEFLNFINWVCMYRKALYMYEAVKEDVLPLIEEVLSVQEKITIYATDENGNRTGDSIIGFVDMVVRLKGYKTPVILDWKTSSIEYEEDSVRLSQQLSVYLHELSDKYENTRLAGYGVIQKRIPKNKTKVCTVCGNDGTGKQHKTCDAQVNGKRCGGGWQITLSPRAKVDLIVDEIPEYTENDVLENMANFNQLIKNGIFIKNFSECKKPWGKCPFFSKCRENKGDVGLIKVESKYNENVPPIADAG